MSARKAKRPAKKTVKKQERPPVNMHALVVRYSSALAFIDCALRSLEDDEHGPWSFVIEHAVRDLKDIYNTLERMDNDPADWLDEEEDEDAL